jgi:hypothetical protein
MRSRSCRGTSFREPAPFNAISNVFTELSCPKKRIEITASFHIILKDENHSTQAHRHTHTHTHAMTFTPAASLEYEDDDNNYNSKASQRKGNMHAIFDVLIIVAIVSSVLRIIHPSKFIEKRFLTYIYYTKRYNNIYRSLVHSP